jgi:hypothetical protein
MDLIQTKYWQYQLLDDHQKHLGRNLDFAGVRVNVTALIFQTKPILTTAIKLLFAQDSLLRLC